MVQFTHAGVGLGEGGGGGLQANRAKNSVRIYVDTGWTMFALHLVKAKIAEIKAGSLLLTPRHQTLPSLLNARA